MALSRPRRKVSSRPRHPTRTSPPGTPLSRQWKLIQRLSTSGNGCTIGKLAEASKVGQKTIRRDLILLRKVGFDLVEQIGPHGVKFWRIKRPEERTMSRRKRYQAVRDVLDRLEAQAERLEDRRLVKRLHTVRQAVESRCR